MLTCVLSSAERTRRPDRQALQLPGLQRPPSLRQPQSDQPDHPDHDRPERAGVVALPADLVRAEFSRAQGQGPGQGQEQGKAGHGHGVGVGAGPGMHVNPMGMFLPSMGVPVGVGPEAGTAREFS